MSATPDSQDTAPSMPEITGYRLLRVLGHGGMSTVYLGEQVSLGREVAIKVMLPEALADEVSRRRFENEARTIARLEHPNIVGIHEVGRTRDGLPYYAMPYLARGHLGQRDYTGDAPDGHASVRVVLHALLAALEYAHGRGVVHRDVKAENVLFDEAGRPLLADFGIALRKGFGPRVTTAGLAVGSTAYMAPEQARGENVDARADLYSVGVLAWEMLTGRLPYVAGDALSMAVMHAQDPIPRLPRPLRHWQRFLDKALAKSPAMRFHGASQMREALDRVAQPHQQPWSRLLDRAGHGLAWVRGWPKLAWVGLALVLAAVIGLAAREWPQAGPEQFFRVFQASDALPAPDAAPGKPVVDIADAVLRPLPESPAERWVLAADHQLQQRNLTAPAGNNAYDSLLAGWQADPAYQRLPQATAAVIDALGDAARDQVAAGASDRARDYLDRATRLAAVAGDSGAAALAQLRTDLGKALSARIAALAAKYDRAGAVRVAALARPLGLDAATAKALTDRANAIPAAGDVVGADASMQLVRAGDRVVAVARNEVSREDYARFAAATGRPAALCRERASLLRIVSPRSWRAPGFDQSAAQPVVCVSWGDAESYARWLGKRDGHHYRLPNADEVQALAAGGGSHPVSQWLNACSEGCRKRMASGRSWRGTSGARALDPVRGYDDVGFRLVREP